MKVLLLGLLFAICLTIQQLTSGSIQGSSAIQVKGTAAPQGTASTSTVQSLTTTVTGSAQISLTYGTGSGQVNLIVAQDRTLALSTSETLDLFSGAVLDIFGSAAAFGHVKYLAIYILTGGDINGLTLAGGGSDPFVGPLTGTTPAIIIYPNGPGYQFGEPVTGFAVTALLANIKLTNNSSALPVTYRIVVGGTTT